MASCPSAFTDPEDAIIRGLNLTMAEGNRIARLPHHLAKNASISSMISIVFPPSLSRCFQSSTDFRTEKMKASIAFKSSKNRVRRLLIDWLPALASGV
jgi:hypothetical protein